MEYREIGNTGLKASTIGMGAEHLDGKPYDVVESTIHAAIDSGVNILDVFMPGEDIRKKIGKALKGKRDKVMLQGHICSVDLNQQYDITRDFEISKKYFEDLLRYLETDYIDFGMLFFMDTDEALDQVIDHGILDYMKDLKKKGVVRHLGASSHNPLVARRLVEMGDIEVLLFSINAAFDMTPVKTHVLDTLEANFDGQQYMGIDPARAALYNVCEQHNVGITVMKTLGAGKLLSAEHTPFAKPMTAGQCIHYALTRPAVVSTLLGFKSPEEVADALKYYDMTEEQLDYTDIINTNTGSMKGSCVYCSHCLPCPSEIDIANVNKYLDIAKLDEANIPPSIKQHYASLSAHGSDCIGCGSCEERCPFSVPIIDNMAKANELFGE